MNTALLCAVCQTPLAPQARFCASCGAFMRNETEGNHDDPWVGKTIAKKFLIESLLGQGGMGRAYKARHLTLDRTVVVKVLHSSLVSDPIVVQRFQREARAASRLNNRHSIQIFDFGQDDDGTVYMAMEYVPGEDLYRLLQKQGPLPYGRACSMMLQICEALSEAHGANVIHRDLKPENILVQITADGRDHVKVLDFGIAKIQDATEGQAITRAGTVCGTPEYLAPEAAQGHTVDGRADIYALGIMLYQMLVGKVPFSGDSPVAIITKHLFESAAAPSSMAPQQGIPAELDAVVLKAMAKKPEERMMTVQQLSSMLSGFATQTVMVPSSPPAAIVSSPIRQDAEKKNIPAPVSSPTLMALPGASTPYTNTIYQEEKTPSSSHKWMIPALVALIAVAGGAWWWKISSKDDGTINVPRTVVENKKPQEIPIQNTKQEIVTADNSLQNPTVLVDAGETDSIPVTSTESAQKIAENNEATAQQSVQQQTRFMMAHKIFLKGDCDGAMPELIALSQEDSAFADPLRDIALCYKQIDDEKRACSAMQEYIKRKQIEGALAQQLLGSVCPK